MPCEGPRATCSDWSEYHAANAAWYVTVIDGKIVATRETTFGDMRDKVLERKTVGGFVFSMLRERDDSCPRKPADRCRKDWNTDEELPPNASRFCESDIKVQCFEDGVGAFIEVLEVGQGVVHKFEEVRHMKHWRVRPTNVGRVALELDDCAV